MPRAHRNPALFAAKVILAPMVRCGSLPLRLLALEYGADLVYSPEIVDKRIAKSVRKVNHTMRTVDFTSVDKNNPKRGSFLDFRTLDLEKDKIVFQLGTSSPELAVEAAQKVMHDVSAIDVNCGCPKKFSLQGAMGAALLEDPDRLVSILLALVESISLPISCKIRLLPSFDNVLYSQPPHTTLQPTLDLVERLCQTGISALAVHCRTKKDAYTVAAQWRVLQEIQLITSKHDVTLIANGDVFTAQDISKLSEMGILSTMHARSAQANPSVFLTYASTHRAAPPISEPLARDEAVKAYVTLALKYDMPLPNLKYTALCIVGQRGEYGQRLTRSKTIEEVSEIFCLTEWYQRLLQEREITKKLLPADSSRTVEVDEKNYSFLPNMVLLPFEQKNEEYRKEEKENNSVSSLKKRLGSEVDHEKSIRERKKLKPNEDDQ